jgi:hypothetical protein
LIRVFPVLQNGVETSFSPVPGENGKGGLEGDKGDRRRDAYRVFVVKCAVVRKIFKEG